MASFKRSKNSRKKGGKGTKSQRGQAENSHGGLKARISSSLTGSALENMDNFASAHNISRSELLEQIVRSGSELEGVIQLKIKAHQHVLNQKRTQRKLGAIANRFGERKKATSFSLTPEANVLFQELRHRLNTTLVNTFEYIARSLDEIELLLSSQENK